MRKLGCLIGMFITCGVCCAQNLVPNGDFESFSTCPTFVAQIIYSPPWFSPSPGTPDYYNQCATLASEVDVPINWGGYQQAHSGVAYSGVSLYYDNWANYREYIEVELSTPLVANSCYHFEMFANLPDTCKYTTASIGVYFSNSIISSILFPLPFTPQLNNTSSNIIDSTNWTLISGTYTAVGGELYLIIGNFYDDANTIAILINSTTDHHDSYCYIDDVSLSLCTGINELNQNALMNLYPNPFSEKINITTKTNELVEVNFYDVTGRKIFNHSFINSTSINTEELAKGIYIYEVRDKKGVVRKGKVVKN